MPNVASPTQVAPWKKRPSPRSRRPVAGSRGPGVPEVADHGVLLSIGLVPARAGPGQRRCALRAESLGQSQAASQTWPRSSGSSGSYGLALHLYSSRRDRPAQGTACRLPHRASSPSTTWSSICWLVGCCAGRGAGAGALPSPCFALLAASPGQVFTRDEILMPWATGIVTPSVLEPHHEPAAPDAGEDAQHPRRLHTVYGRRLPLRSADADIRARAGLRGRRERRCRGGAVARPAPAFRRRAPCGRTRRTAAWLGGHGGGAAAVRGRGWSRPHDGTGGARGDEPGPARLGRSVFADLSAGRTRPIWPTVWRRRSSIIGAVACAARGRRRSSFSFRGRSTDLRTIGQRFGVAHLLRAACAGTASACASPRSAVRVEDGSQSVKDLRARAERRVRGAGGDRATWPWPLSVTLDVARFSREQAVPATWRYERFLRWRNIVMREEFDSSTTVSACSWRGKWWRWTRSA